MTDAEFYSGLVPEMAEAAKLHRSKCEHDGLPIVFISGFRTWAQQLERYGQGRELTPEGWKIVDRAKVVTDALPPDAPHCRGAAYDLAPLFKEKIDWTRIDLFQAVAERMPAGLTWSGTWKGRLHEYGHYEWSAWRTLPPPQSPPGVA